MSSPSPPPEPEPFEATVTVTLSSQVPAPATKSSSTKKAAAPKLKTETKNKQLKFKFSPEPETYAKFMNDILESHNLLSKYGPASASSRFPLRVLVPPAKKADAVDIEKFKEYKDMVVDAATRRTPPTKLTVIVTLKDIKAAAKKRKSSGGSENDDESESGSDDSGNGKDADEPLQLERELGRLRGLLEDKYRNPHDAGYTYRTDDGDLLPLTPGMMKEWTRALYDHTATVALPPQDNVAFSVAHRGRTLPGRRSRQPSGSQDGLAHVSSIFGSLTTLLGQTVPHSIPSTPIQQQQQPLASPAKNTPSKLSRFLSHAETALGITHASSYLEPLERNGYGPDVISAVEDSALSDLGLKPGDVIRLKRGAQAWWNSPEAKRQRTSSPHLSPSPPPHNTHAIRFEKHYADGGLASFFGSSMIDGRNVRSADYTWWYYSKEECKMLKVPDGKVPLLAEEYVGAREAEDPDDD
ncbi:hypothetical protein DXG01_008213 [Tephrocybe rancida]|nr:hypothetical protein DXG01_008213 [Tephrocybe rancida]